MTNRILLAGAATLALTLAACSGGEEAAPADTDDTVMADPAATDAAAGADAAAMPTTAQAFVDMAAASDMFEVEAGKLAGQMGTAQEVKDFAAMMVADHTKSSADLKAAAAEGEGVTVNPRMTAKQQSDLDALRAAGTGFDALYKQQQVAAHEQALAMLRGYAANGDVQALKDFAGKTAPVVEGHLEHARGL